MRHIPIVLGGVVILFFMGASFVQLVSPITLSDSMTIVGDREVVSAVDSPVVASSTSEITKSDSSTPDTPVSLDESMQAACPEDAKICTDGTVVGREGLDCEFSACPVLDTVTCPDNKPSDVMCLDVYKPVCGQKEIKCAGEECEIALQTFGNGCSACQDVDVVSYTQGACGEIPATF